MAMHTELQIHKTAEELLGLQASHSHKDRAGIANVLLRRGFSVDRALTKTFPPRRRIHANPF
ncbi:hypothetical protein PZS78_20315 [Pseudomonas aeruginosa]|uniref:hypothetical protein n=1 Tax=Pseudomonas aeruginosa TaxID=287 RepID=UPI002B272684|nr:hypothetical protein [Pseudomonas aeruginosa]MEA8473998.1 hypothetical protein [Pseudomonas aeruginosa]HCL4064635.1 hypothetical protein [Pseudomonas aeruginosa]